MKIFYESKLAKIFTFMEGFKTIMLFGAVFTEEEALSMRVEFHEQSHVEQYKTMFSLGAALAVIIMFVNFAFDSYGWWMLSLLALPVFLYYIWYGIEYFIRILITRDSNEAYRQIAFEQEARDLQDEYKKPCESRRTASSFSFFKYY